MSNPLKTAQQRQTGSSKLSSAGQLLALEQCQKAVIAVVGCGGKTSFVQTLAKELGGRNKVLISPTTKIALPRLDDLAMEHLCVTICTSLLESMTHTPHIGVQWLGELQPQIGKLVSLPLTVLQSLVNHYDVALLEADGSKGLPCKGWRQGGESYEPVVPPYATHTVGIVTLQAVGKLATTNWVHRLEEFCALINTQPNHPITEKTMMQMVCDTGGMFWNSVGKRCLVVNVSSEENGREWEQARRWLCALKRAYPNKFDTMAVGNVLHNVFREE